MTEEQETENETPEPTWPRVVKLKHPVELGSALITELTFRRGRLGDAKGLKIDGVPPVDDLVKIASRMCGQPLGVIERLDVDDAGAVIAIAILFVASCLTAGR